MSSHLLQTDRYHVHVYCEPTQLSLCNEIRTQMLSDVQGIEGAGPVRSRPIGPHPLPMFEAWFPTRILDDVVRWAMANRRGLSVLIHPLSGNHLADHRDHALWLGKPLPLDLKFLEELGTE